MKKLIFTVFGLCMLPIVIVLVAAPFNDRTDADENYQASTLLKQKPPVLSEAITLKVMTYNIANARGFTTNRRERIVAVADLLLDLDVDLVGIQEAFVEEDRKVFFQKLANSPLKYFAEYPAATVGNGIVVLSKFPIEESYFHRYRANNPWYKVWEGDWWAGKGIALARVRLDNGAVVDFYNTHAQAYRGNQDSHDIRYDQFKEGAEFLNQSKIGTAPAFFVGDFNTEQDQPDYQHAVDHAGMVRLMNIDSRIDHITGLENEHYEFEVLDTQEIFGTTMGSHAGEFYSRAPTPVELWRMFYGEPEETQLSDHPGYTSTIKIIPKQK